MQSNWIPVRKLLFLVLLAFTCLSTTAQQPPLADIKAAAEGGNPTAQLRLGEAYNHRLDFVNAEIWFRKAATSGLAEGQFELERILMLRLKHLSKSEDVRKRIATEAVEWCYKAANQGHGLAQMDYGETLAAGKYVAPDPIEAYKWFALAAKSSNAWITAKGQLDNLILKLSQEQIAEGERRAAAFVPRWAASGDIPEPASFSQLKLTGIIGSNKKRLAMINGVSFAEGDIATVKLLTDKVQIKCLQIQDHSVIITMDGIKGSRELTMMK